MWPDTNRRPRPVLDEVLPASASAARALETVLASRALERLWNARITGDQLQAELDRMARATRDPRLLRRYLEALDFDPWLAAECLARPVLAQRLLRDRYATDPRRHAAVRAQAQADRATHATLEQLRQLGARYTECDFARLDDGAPRSPGRDESRLDDGEWRELVGELARELGADSPELASAGISERLPVGRVSALFESADAFLARVVVAARPDHVTVGTARWPKVPFSTWWASARARLDPDSGELEPVAPSSGAFSLPEVATSADLVDTWHATPQDIPDGRSSHTAVWTGTEMIVWGGNSTPAPPMAYDPATDCWRGLSNPVGAPQQGVAVWTGTEMIAWDEATRVVGRYSPALDSWALFPPDANAPSARLYASGVWSGDELIVWGGTGGDGALDTGGRFDPATSAWIPTSTGPGTPSARYKHVAVWTGQEMVVWGGGAGLDTGGRYRPSTDSWAPVSTIDAPQARHSHTAVWTGSEMIVWGGKLDGQPLDSGGRYDPVLDAWTPTALAGAPHARYTHTAVWTGSEMIVWGGRYESSLGDGGRYAPATDSWSPVTGIGAPRPTAEHSAVWTGSEMIVWGGWGGPYGGRYSPSADSWTGLTPHALTPPRYRHTAVWTGTEMILWGGLSIGTRDFVSAGRAYDPALDAWRALSAVDEPQPRIYHSAVFTGAEMIIWGGSDESTRFATGGAYNVAGDSWRAIAAAPVARNSHTTVWTGAEVIVWGGWLDSASSNTGEAYDPSLDSWRSLPTAGAPTPRTYHSAVWTGEEMIVWGGYWASTNTGGAYNPALDAWRALPTAGAPSARDLHVAVWTGREMLVWGGYASSPRSGGRYEPGSDTWRPMSADNSPASTTQIAAAWTGSYMLVWGGQSGSGFPRGSLYDPRADSWTVVSDEGAPSARALHSIIAVTGTSEEQAIVWGGLATFSMSSGGVYTACSKSTWWRDSDGDGYGDPAQPVSSCIAPESHAARAGDCADADPSAWPGAIERCNGIDDDCSGITDDVPQPLPITGLTVQRESDLARLGWDANLPESLYDVIRGDVEVLLVSGGDFEASTGECVANDETATTITDAAPVAEGHAAWYLVRAQHCGGAGTYDDGDGLATTRDPGIAGAAASCP
ncbi:MAG: hypothetical protein KBD01_18795 [Acidobacteria bacterium]|nr:hypothetical protein [Acidobacteriota bacterium]